MAARICDTCGKEMWEGYVWDGGMGYACSDECFFVDGYTPEQYTIDYDDGHGDIFWTDWYDED